MWMLLLNVAQIVAGGIVLTVVSGSVLVRNAQRWWIFVITVAVAAAISNLAIQIRNNPTLYRDVTAVVVIAMLSPIAIGATARSLRDQVTSFRVLGSIAVLALSAILTPLVVLITHCTSGDCL
jgi:hypothetical protein